ncbi:hypothetical protein EYR36_002985 [Pleurotus pulmonarius]|nr:hypothetical protein EYR36_002985 [Pleurotus pulmonarius]
MISYSPLAIPLSSGRDLTLVRRDLFDARFQLISEAEEDPDEETSKREKISESSLKFVDSPSDLVPGVYEGGLKTWECALDLVDYLENGGARRPTGKVILELGCGTAIPSIYLLERLFAQPPTNTGLPMTHIHLQDYNDAVLQLVTLPNILLNWYMSPASISFRQSITSTEVSFPPVDSTAPGELPITSELVAAFQDSLPAFNISLRFFAGSWETFDLQQSLSLTKEDANGDRTYDMVLTSETIYRVESLSALIELMKKAVGQHEYQCLVAAKVLYFGVGGGVSEFVARVEGQSGRVETVWEKSAGVGRKIMQVLRLFDLELRLLFYMPPSPLELWSSSAKGHIHRDLDPACHFFRNIDIPLEDFVTALFSISKDDISGIESRPWDMIDDLVSNYGRMVQEKTHESKLYPFFQRILVRLAQELGKDEDLAFVARTVHTSGLKNQYFSRKPDGLIWWNTGDHAWHLMKATIEMKRRHEYNHLEFGYLPQTMPDIVYDTELPSRGSKAGPSAPRIPTNLEMPQLAGNPSTQPSDLLPLPSAVSPDGVTATISDSRIIPPVPPGPLPNKTPLESEARKQNKRRKTSRLTIDHTKIVNHALESMGSTVHRRWSIGVMVDNFWVTFWYFDRMGAIVTQPFDFAEEPWKLALVTLALGRCTPAQAGFEPLILQPNGDATTDLPSFDRPINTVVGAEIVLPCDIAKPSKQDPRFVITAPPLYVYRGVVGRGSIVYPVKAFSGQFQNRELVAKWSWPLAVRKREHELIDRLRKLVPSMRQHLPEVIEHREYSMNEVNLPRYKMGSGEESLGHEARKLTIVILPRYKHLWELETVEKFNKLLFRISRPSRRVLFAAVQSAFKPLIGAWLEPLLNLFAQAQFRMLDHDRNYAFDKDTMGGILTFESFMKAIGVVPRDIAAESNSDLGHYG